MKRSKEERWAEHLEKLIPLFDMAYNGIVIVDRKGIIQIYNEAARKVLGIRGKDLVGRPIQTINPLPWKDMKEIINTGTPQIAKKISINESTIIANRSPIYFDGKIVGVISIFQDISEYEKVSSELESFKRLNEELDAIIESSYDGLYITDAESRTLRVNQAYERITGIKKKEVLGKRTEDLVSNGLFKPSVTLEVLKKKRPITIMQQIKAGKTVMVTGNPIFDFNKRIIRVVTNVRDMTELNQLRSELEETKQLTRRYQEQLNEQQYLSEANQELVIKSEAMRLVFQKALKMARVDSSVLLTGESGVGKDLLARFIHKAGLRKENNFVKINCGAIPQNLLESELFGYDKGAFTGARGEGKAGLLEMGEGGTVFLDEIADLPIYLQVKILSAIEDKEVTRLGGTRPKKIDFRLIAATNRDLTAMVRNGTFREDLYFRLSILPLAIPALRERKEDVVPLINHFLKKYNQIHNMKKTFTQEVYDRLIRYSLPGNVRELMNIVEQLVVMSENQAVTFDELPHSLRVEDPSLSIAGDLNNFKLTRADIEKKLIEEALKKHKTLQQVAQFLGVNQSTVSRKIHQYNIKRT
ncbi:MAG: sigma 54-interacting transcriptional regulator [Proteobacteria bacterium]|nr:sigma 54-interacting transcriptional regulator [Pseudomonadota bacterium]MBU1569757.1 sigma 54-interacting transcriptional regulator [Pseudomonadota bacterium]